MMKLRTLILLMTAVVITQGNLMAGKKVLFIDSYHEGYAWSDGITKGVKGILGDKVELKIHRMDTKRNASEEFKKEAALKAKAVIDEWTPDVVIASDDNASKYLIEPYYKGKDLPFVFCGLNWDSSKYGFPAKNVCGMEEVSLVTPLLGQLKKFAKGDKIGFLGPDTATAQKEYENVAKRVKLTMTGHFSKNFEDWKTGYSKLQNECDIIIVESDGGLYKEHEADMKEFVLVNTTKPTGSCYDFMAPYTLISFSKSSEEQGEWAAAAALRILGGESPEKIGVTQNKKGKLYINLPLSQKMGVKIPLNMLKTAEVIKK